MVQSLNHSAYGGRVWQRAKGSPTRFSDPANCRLRSETEFPDCVMCRFRSVEKSTVFGQKAGVWENQFSDCVPRRSSTANLATELVPRRSPPLEDFESFQGEGCKRIACVQATKHDRLFPRYRGCTSLLPIVKSVGCFARLWLQRLQEEQACSCFGFERNGTHGNLALSNSTSAEEPHIVEIGMWPITRVAIGFLAPTISIEIYQIREMSCHMGLQKLARLE